MTHLDRTVAVGDEAALRLLGLSGVAGPAAADEAAAPADQEAVGERVRSARKRARLNGSELGSRVGLGKDQISKIERGTRRLRAREVPAFASALGVSARFLLGARESPRLAMAHRLTQALEDSPEGPGELPGTQRRALELLRAESLLAAKDVLPPSAWSVEGETVRSFVASSALNRRPRTKAEANRHGKQLAEVVRSALDLGSAPLRDVAALMESHFAVDVALSPLGDGVDGLFAHTEGQGVIVASSDFSDGHIRFTLAHELGHLLLSDGRDVIAEDGRAMFADDMLEKRVNAFAAHLLMPAEGIRRAVASLAVPGHVLAQGGPGAQRVLGHLTLQFGVSLQALVYQLADLNVVTFTAARGLADSLSAGQVQARSRLSADTPGVGTPLAESVNGTVRPPRRLLEAALNAARSGVIGTGVVALLLEREDDDALFDEVMGHEEDPADVDSIFAD